MRLHTRYRHVKHEAVSASERLFELKPWRIKGDDNAEEVLTTLVQTWADEMCRIYEVPHVSIVVDYKNGTRYGNYNPVTVLVDEEGNGEGMQEAQIVLGYFSLTNMFWRFASHLYVSGALEVVQRPDEDSWDFYGRQNLAPFAWACSLFYLCKPVMFRARVREARISGIAPSETYCSETLAQMEDAGIDPSLRDALDQLRNAENEAVSLDEPATSEEDQLAEANLLTTASSQPEAEGDNDTSPDGEALRAMNVRELRRYATEQGITGSWSMGKAALLEALGVTPDFEVRTEPDNG